jgi:predicted aminopeptidase
VKRSNFRPLLLIALTLALSGCIGPGYYAQSLKGHVEILAARQSVAKLINASFDARGAARRDGVGQHDQAVCQ